MLNIILRVAEVIFLGMTIYCIFYINKGENTGEKASGVILALVFIVLFAICIGIEVLKVGYNNKCPSCNVRSVSRKCLCLYQNVNLECSYWIVQHLKDGIM